MTVAELIDALPPDKKISEQRVGQLLKKMTLDVDYKIVGFSYDILVPGVKKILERNTQHNEISFSELSNLDDNLEINFYLLREENEQEKESRLRKESNREAAKKEERRLEYLVLKKEFGE